MHRRRADGTIFPFTGFDFFLLRIEATEECSDFSCLPEIETAVQLALKAWGDGGDAASILRPISPHRLVTRLHSADWPNLVRHPLRPFPRQSSCAHDGNSGLGGVHFASPVAIGFDEQFIWDRAKTRTRTRTSEPFLTWVGFSRLKHACTRPDKLPGGKTGQASPIPTLASIPIRIILKAFCESSRATRTQTRTRASSGL